VRRLLLMTVGLASSAVLALVPAGAAHADNAQVVPHTSALVTVETYGGTAGRVRVCVRASGGPILIVSERVHDYSRDVMTRMGGGGHTIWPGHSHCATTGNWFRFTRAFVTVGVVNADDGSHGFAMIPVT
jgi:hypothetical protein